MDNSNEIQAVACYLRKSLRYPADAVSADDVPAPRVVTRNELTKLIKEGIAAGHLTVWLTQIPEVIVLPWPVNCISSP